MVPPVPACTSSTVARVASPPATVATARRGVAAATVAATAPPLPLLITELVKVLLRVGVLVALLVELLLLPAAAALQEPRWRMSRRS